MKKIAVLYSITLIVGVSLILGINHWTTATRWMPPPVQQTTIDMDNVASEDASTETVAPTQTAKTKKKPCPCCAERMARMKEHLLKARKRKQLNNGIGVKTPVYVENGK